jgi:hypothetical protein
MQGRYSVLIGSHYPLIQPLVIWSSGCEAVGESEWFTATSVGVPSIETTALPWTTRLARTAWLIPDITRLAKH